MSVDGTCGLQEQSGSDVSQGEGLRTVLVVRMDRSEDEPKQILLRAGMTLQQLKEAAENELEVAIAILCLRPGSNIMTDSGNEIAKLQHGTRIFAEVKNRKDIRYELAKKLQDMADKEDFRGMQVFERHEVEVKRLVFLPAENLPENLRTPEKYGCGQKTLAVLPWGVKENDSTLRCGTCVSCKRNKKAKKALWGPARPITLQMELHKLPDECQPYAFTREDGSTAVVRASPVKCPESLEQTFDLIDEDQLGIHSEYKAARDALKEWKKVFQRVLPPHVYEGGKWKLAIQRDLSVNDDLSVSGSQKSLTNAINSCWLLRQYFDIESVNEKGIVARQGQPRNSFSLGMKPRRGCDTKREYMLYLRKASAQEPEHANLQDREEFALDNKSGKVDVIELPLPSDRKLKLRICDVLGKGSFATVVSCQLLVDDAYGKKFGDTLAFKLLHNQRLGEERSRLEAEQSKRFDSPYIIKTFDSFKMYCAQLMAVMAKSDAIPGVDSGILMDLADTTLEKYVYDQACLEGRPIEDGWLNECRSYMREMAAGVGYLHIEMDVAHRDLKPDNVLLKKEDGAYHVKISDFSLVKTFGGKTVNSLPAVVRNMYQADESGRRDLDDDACKKCDVYSLGLIYTALAIRKRTANGILDPDLELKNFQTNSKGRQKLRNLIKHTRDVLTKRADIKWVMNHPFLLQGSVRPKATLGLAETS